MKLKKFFAALVIPFFLGVMPVKAEEKSLVESIDAIIEPYYEDMSVSIKIESLTNGELVYERDSDNYLIPASNVKLPTGIAALGNLGSDYHFTTMFYGEIIDCVVKDLYVKGYGDPSLVTEELEEIVDKFVEKGVKEISGNIFFDDSYFDDDSRAPGYSETEPEEELKTYNAQLGALSLNFNIVNVLVKGGKKKGYRTSVSTDPFVDYFKIENKTKTSSKRGVWANKTDDGVAVYGSVRPRQREIFRMSIDEPGTYFSSTLKHHLEDSGIRVKGEVKEGEIPEDSKILLIHISKPLGDIVADMNEFSNNLIADQLVKVLDAEFNERPGKYFGGLGIITNYLEGVVGDGYVIADGSGLSRNSLFTADDFVGMLSYAYGQKFFDCFMEGLVKRYDDQIRMKTGTLDDVSAMSGYMLKDGDWMAFSILINSEKLKISKMREIQENIIKEVLGIED
ncbi:MAG: D-alanyl-D-alanine carboxypeptidase/D-alanyl-D-alanine-endopeptidase [Nanoarchaeota archaeon]|nr:D-alanyl-D-alanine carboxypeptidase/D-alanyl-D-alanine-endopeptidase [Nanoarchaeota archaeon]